MSSDKLSQIETLMSQRNYGAALSLSLDWTPAEIKDNPEKCTSSATKAMGYIKDADITKFVNELEETKYDFLMKIVYKALSNPDSRSSSYMKWHAALFDKAGLGCIVRTMTDKKI